MTTFMPGDILFYESKGTLYDRAIEFATHSPYVHVAIAVSAAQKIEALISGIMLTPIDNESAARYWSYTEHVPGYNKVQLSNALNWLMGMKGTAYGWDDVASSLFASMGLNIDISDNRWACSFLAAEFLINAGGVTSLMGVNPHTLTPGLLAKNLGVP